MKQLNFFFLGIMGALGALIIEILSLFIFLPNSFDAEFIAQSLTSINLFFFFAVFAEEFFKFILLSKFLTEFSSQKISVLNSFFFGLGFSSLEVSFFYWNYRQGFFLDFKEISGVILVHVLTSMVIGFSLIRYSPKKLKIYLGFIVALLIHVFFNLAKISDILNENIIYFSMAFIFLVLISATLFFPENIKMKIEEQK